MTIVRFPARKSIAIGHTQQVRKRVMEATGNTRQKIIMVFFALVGATIVSAVWGTLLAQSALLGLMGISAVGYFFVIFLRPFFATLLFLFALPLGPLLNLPFTQGGFLLSLVVVQTGFAVWVIRALFVRDESLSVLPLTKPVHLLMLAFVSAMGLSLLNTPEMTASLNQIKRFTYYVIIYFFIVYTVKDVRRFKWSIFVLLAGYFVAALLGLVEGIAGKGIYEFLGHRSLLGGPLPPPVLDINPGKLNGPAGNAEFHSFRMITFFACLLALLVVWRSGMKKAAIVGVILVALINIIGTSYRGAVLGLLVSGATFCLAGRLRRKWLIVTASVLLILSIGWSVYMIFPQLDVERLTKTSGHAVETVAFRKNNIIIGLEMAADHPIIGNGPDGFLLNYHRYRSILPQAHVRAVKVHNTYVQVLAEYGIIGLSIFGLIIVLTLRNVFSALKRLEGWDHFMVVSLFSALLAHVAMMIGGNILLDDNWWTLVALGGVVDRIYARPVSDA